MQTESSGHPSPCYAVIFTSRRTEADQAGYAKAAARMLELAADQPGFLGVEDARDANGVGITASYWTDLDSIRRWREHPEHAAARQSGRENWYQWFRLRVCKVEHESSWKKPSES